MGQASDGTKQPQAAQLTRAQVRRMLGVTARQLSNWERQGWIEAVSPPPGSAASQQHAATRVGGLQAVEQPCYSFADVAALRTILRLRRSGVSARRLRSLQIALRRGPMPANSPRSWNDLQVQSHGKQLSIYYQGTRLEPLTGQFLLDFTPPREPSNLRPMDSALRHRHADEAERRARADRFFLAGLRYEDRAETVPKAIQAYQKATELNPRALGAFINLGTIYYHQGSLDEAERCYRAALALNPHSALVHFNLGNLLEEQGQLVAARDHYEQAIHLAPTYADPRFNLALVYERLGRHGKACQQWRGYLRLDSESRWASYARQKLEQIPLRVVSSSNTAPHRS